MNRDLQVVNMASSSSSSAVILPQQKYDVFLSFRGADTRQKFTSHLYAALKWRRINTYMDDRLERGDKIEHALMKAIEESKLSVIIFSKHYAYSGWCLNELTHILKDKETYGQLVIPVFYDIDPSHVRKLQGSYADAFTILEERFKDSMDKVRMWRDAVSTASNLSGFDSKNFRTEAELVEKIVNVILVKLNRTLSASLRGLVGIEKRIQHIETLLCIQGQDVPFRIVGIWGMGGIGKTTLADTVFHRLSSKFDACSFLPNVREDSEKHGIRHVRRKFLCELLKDESLSIDSPSIGLTSITERLSRTKVLVVLDDVNDSSQLESLLDEVVFASGSRIIITSRDRRTLMERVHDDHIYAVMGLNSFDALELFHLKAFKDNSSKTDYSDLSRRVVEYAKGIPLALKVLSYSFRHCNSRKDWEDELNKLKKFPDRKIQDVLRVSYNGLQENEKGIFLDIACFLKRKKRCDAERILEMHGFCASRGIAVLIDMSLISISMYGYLEMHDLLQEMGRSIVHEQCIHDPGRRSRLWNGDDVSRVLRNNIGTATIEAMFVDISMIRELHLSRTTFRNMCNLRMLKFYATWKGSQLHLPQGLESLPEELRYLYWYEYRYKSLPSTFSPFNLVELHMPHSQIEKLWKNGQNLGSLKVMNLSFSRHLIEVPDLSRSPNIEKINLHGCTSLVRVPLYIKNLDKLIDLNLGGCSNLETFPEIPCNMKLLDLSYSKHLTEIPNLSLCPKIEKINLTWCTSLVQVPSYFQNLEKLTSLNLGFCSNLEYLAELSCNMEFLDLSYCTNLESVPDSICNLEHLQKLNLFGCPKLKKFPPFSGFCNISEIPGRAICLSSLHTLNLSGSMIDSIPASIINVFGLRELYLYNCRRLLSLPVLPMLLGCLEADGCTSLKIVASSSAAIRQELWERHYHEDPYNRQERLIFTNCLELGESARSSIMSDAYLRFMRMASSKLIKTSPVQKAYGRPLQYLNHNRFENAVRNEGPEDSVPDISPGNGILNRYSYHTEDSVWVIYPGNEIPKWFIYHTEGGSLKIKLRPYWFHTTKFLGFALSAVVDRTKGNCWLNYFRCKCYFKTNNGECYEEVFRTSEEPVSINSDHVVALFIEIKHLNGCSRPIPFEKITEASFHFFPEALPGFKVGSKVKVRKCGIRLLYTHDSGHGTGRASVGARLCITANNSETLTCRSYRDTPRGGLSSTRLFDGHVDENNEFVLRDLSLQEAELFQDANEVSNNQFTVLANAGEALAGDWTVPENDNGKDAEFEEEEDPMDFEEALDFKNPRKRTRDMMKMESGNETQDGNTSDDDPNP